MSLPVLFLLALSCFTLTFCNEILCRNVAYCSTGLLAGYVGPMDTAEQTKRAFELTHYKRELIVFAETRVEQAVHMADRSRRAGYGHVLPVLVEPEDCQRFSRIFTIYDTRHGASGAAINMSCGWYRSKDDAGNPNQSGFEYLKYEVGVTAWWRKWFTVARAVALGYNVMAIDEDVVPLGDWYGRVKAAPVSQYTMLSQAECPNCINGGFTYVQNAAPNGPVAYLLYEAMYRAVRWADNSTVIFGISKELGKNEERFYQEDQSLLTDVLHSCIAGRPLYTNMLSGIGPDEEGWAKIGGRDAMMKSAYELAIHKMYKKELLLEGPMADVVWGDPYPVTSDPPREPDGRLRVTLLTANLSMPHSGGEWPLHMGGYLYGTPGPYARAYRKAFEDLGVPLPPDPEDPASEAEARAAKQELFALLGLDEGGVAGVPRRMLGAWLEHNWFPHGRLGHWHLHLHPKYTMGMGHIHAGLTGSGFPGPLDKRVVLQHTGHYNWHLAAWMGGGPARVFFATAHDEQAKATLGRVVAYAPGVLHHGLSKEAYVAAVAQLARVAVALRAVAAWPPADCSSDWVLVNGSRGGPKPVRHSIPWLHLNTAYTVAPFGRSLSELKCEWSAFQSWGCLVNDGGLARGLLAVEFEHLLHGREGHAPPQMTLKLHNPTGPPSPPSPPPPSAPAADTSAPAAAFHRISYRQLLSYNADMLLAVRHWGQPLWLDRLVEVSELPEAHEAVLQGWRERCGALRYYELTDDERRNW